MDSWRACKEMVARVRLAASGGPPPPCTDAMLQQLLLCHADTAIGTQCTVSGCTYTITSLREQLAATRLSEEQSSGAGGCYTFTLNHPGDGLKLHGGTGAADIQTLPDVDALFEYEGSTYRVVSRYAPRLCVRGPRGGKWTLDVDVVRASLAPPTCSRARPYTYFPDYCSCWYCQLRGQLRHQPVIPGASGVDRV